MSSREVPQFFAVGKRLFRAADHKFGRPLHEKIVFTLRILFKADVERVFEHEDARIGHIFVLRFADAAALRVRLPRQHHNVERGVFVLVSVNDHNYPSADNFIPYYDSTKRRCKQAFARV